MKLALAPKVAVVGKNEGVAEEEEFNEDVKETIDGVLELVVE
jgi:hypothetical protein